MKTYRRVKNRLRLIRWYGGNTWNPYVWVRSIVRLYKRRWLLEPNEWYGRRVPLYRNVPGLNPLSIEPVVDTRNSFAETRKIPMLAIERSRHPKRLPYTEVNQAYYAKS